jgi:ABC-type transport system involved in cytochrome c biogenesis permease subunit
MMKTKITGAAAVLVPVLFIVALAVAIVAAVMLATALRNERVAHAETAVDLNAYRVMAEWDKFDEERIADADP